MQTTAADERIFRWKEHRQKLLPKPVVEVLHRKEVDVSPVIQQMSKKDTTVSCEACECKFNEDHACHAGHIGISGGHADSSRETECGSFVCSC